MRAVAESLACALGRSCVIARHSGMSGRVCDRKVAWNGSKEVHRGMSQASRSPQFAIVFMSLIFLPPLRNQKHSVANENCSALL